jgi:hypothetical protein
LTGTNAPAGYTYKWYVLKNETAKETFRQNSASVNLFETAGHLFNTNLTPTITVTGPGSYYLQCISPNNWKSSVREFRVANAIPENLNASNNSPAELGGVVALTIGQVVPATAYSWTGPPGSNFSQAIRNPLITGLTEAHIGTYTVTISVGEACSYTSTTAVTLANCDIYIQGYDGTGAETFELVRNGGQTTTATYQPLTLKVLPFEGTNTFGNYNITWMLNGNPISGAPNKPEYIAAGPGTYTAQLSLKLNPATNCVAEAQVNAKPCNNYSEVACGAPVDVHLPDIQAAGVSLAPGDKFTAGDYTVVITEISSGDPSGYIGTGYVEMRLVAEIVAKKIAVDFTNLVVNTCYEMAAGDVVTQYDPNWGGILDVDATIGEIKDLLSDFKGIYTKVYDDIEVLDCTVESKNKVSNSIESLNDINTNFANLFGVSPTEAGPFKTKLSEISTSLSCKVQQTCPSAGGRVSATLSDCAFEENKTKFEDLFCEISSIQTKNESISNSSARIGAELTNNETYTEDLLFYSPSGQLLKWSAYNGSFAPIYNTTTGLPVQDAAVVSFFNNGNLYRGRYKNYEKNWHFIGYYKDGETSPFRFSSLGTLDDGNDGIRLPLLLGRNSNLSVVRLPPGTKLNFVGNVGTVTEKLLQPKKIAVKKVPNFIQIIPNLICELGIIAYTTDESTIGMGPLSDYIPTTKEYNRPIADPSTFPADAPVKLPQECIDDFESGTCGVYVITGPNFSKDFPEVQKNKKFDIAKYGMTCNLGGVRPNTKTNDFNVEHAGQISSNTVSPGLNFEWKWVVKNISKDECHRIEKDLTAEYVIQDYEIYRKGRLPWKHKLPKFADPESYLDEDTGLEGLNYEKRRRRAREWQIERKANCN